MILHLDYNGEQLPVRISYHVISQFQEKGLEISDIQNNYKLYEDVLYYALESGFRGEKKEFTYTREDMVEILEECMWDFAAMLPLFMKHLNDKRAKLQQATDQVQMKTTTTTPFKEQTKNLRKAKK